MHPAFCFAVVVVVDVGGPFADPSSQMDTESIAFPPLPADLGVVPASCCCPSLDAPAYPGGSLNPAQPCVLTRVPLLKISPKIPAE